MSARTKLLRTRDGRPFATIGEAAVLCAIAAHWKVNDCGASPTEAGRLAGHMAPRQAMRALARRGFLSIGGRGRYMDYRTAKPTLRGWSELGVSP